MASISGASSSLVLDNQSGVSAAQERQDLALNSPTVNSNFNGFALIVQFSYSPAVTVPEPSSILSCGIAGVTGLAVARVRRKRIA